MSDTVDLTVQILREIRDEARKTNERLGCVEEEARKTNARLDHLSEQMDHLTGRVNAVEVVLTDFSGQFAFLVRFVKNTQKRMTREMVDVRRRLSVVEERVGIMPE